MFPTGDKSKTARDTWANLIPNPYQPDRKWRALHAARGMQDLQIVSSSAFLRRPQKCAQSSLWF